jgi:Peptidase family M1 domain
VTKVIGEIPAKIFLLFLLAAILPGSGLNASQPPSSGNQQAASGERTSKLIPQSVEDLYDQLGTVGLDKARVYKAREIALDRAAFHISLDDGTIAFTQDVAGRVTGAFFEGEGDVLLAPPDQVERASMARFTGAAILEEKFESAYFRFNDNTFEELEPLLRPADDADRFVSRWNDTARNLADSDALRLLVSFSRLLPVKGDQQATTAKLNAPGDDRMLHARIQGQKLGNFDLYFDTNAGEQVWAGQLKTVEGTSYYDVWSSFSPPTQSETIERVGAVSTGESASEFIDVSHYRIATEIKPPRELEARASLELEVRQGGQRAVLFELSRFLRIKQVEAGGHPLEFIHNQALEGTQLARRGNDLVAVLFPEPLRTGQTVSLDFSYGGEVLSEAGGGLLYVGARGTWYPNRGLGMSNFDLTFRYPSQWMLVATGKKLESAPSDKNIEKASAGEQTGHWVSERPIPVAGFNLGRYSRAVAHSASVLVETYAAAGVEHSFPKGSIEENAPETLGPSGFRRPERQMIVAAPPPSPARHAQSVAEQSARAISFFSRRFGPYPYSSLALAQIPGGLSQGWPSLIFLSSYSFLTADEKSQLHMSPVEKSLSSGVIAHETAHQWWGDLLTWKTYRDQWIMEALANYSSLMLMETDDPAQFRAVMDKYREDLLSKNKEGSRLSEAGPVTLGTRLTSSHFPAGYEVTSYGRGTWLIHMLCSMMRDAEVKRGGRGGSSGANDLFLSALVKLRQRYQGNAITTHDLLKVLEEELPPSLWYEGKKSLDWFYQSWINGTSIPRLELESVKYIDKSGTTMVIGGIRQKDAPNNLVTSVPLYGVLGGKSVHVLLGRVFADGPETNFHLVAPLGTRKVVLDPQQTILARVK